MNENELLDLIGETDDALLLDAKKRTRPGIKWAATAACLCLIAGGIFALTRPQSAETLSPADYFPNAGGGISAEQSIAAEALPYQETRDFSDNREEYEAQSVIPTVDTHPLFSAQANYLDDGSLYSLTFSWYRRDSQYSDLTVTAAPNAITLLEDTVVVEEGQTTTLRDGIEILGTGGEKQEKALTYQTDSGWYRITGSWNDSYDAVVDLLDFFWTHPVDFSQFPMEAGVRYTDSDLQEQPDAFLSDLPDFEGRGYTCAQSYVRLKNGSPVYLEAHYFSQAGEEVHWCINAAPTVYDNEASLGNLPDIQKEQVLTSAVEGKVVFTQNGKVVTVYCDNPETVWSLMTGESPITAE